MNDDNNRDPYIDNCLHSDTSYTKVLNGRINMLNFEMLKFVTKWININEYLFIKEVYRMNPR